MLHLSYSSEPVMRLDYRISLKSPALNLLAGSVPASASKRADMSELQTHHCMTPEQ